MGKLCRKHIVYLDQNFLSEMAKAKDNERVKPDFTRIFELLHAAFKEERIVIPRSWFHDMESSLIPRLKEHIRDYQGYLGQVALCHQTTVQVRELEKAIEAHKGMPTTDRGYRFVFEDDPDKRTQPFDIRVDLGLSVDWQPSRTKSAMDLNALKAQLKTDGVTYAVQQQRELLAQAKSVVRERLTTIRAAFKNDLPQIKNFVVSGEIQKMSSVEIYAAMWAKLLADFPTRSIKESDETDIEILSTYLPYVDVLATDTFMATLVRNLGFDTKFGTKIFGASNAELKSFEAYINQELPKLKPVNTPVLAVVVVSDKGIKQNSWEFFRKLGGLARANEIRHGGWVEVFAFDDGTMPNYRREGIDSDFPFYGLQEVNVLPMPSGATKEHIIALCREHVRAPALVIVDKYWELPDGFIQTTLRNIAKGQWKVLGFDILRLN